MTIPRLEHDHAQVQAPLRLMSLVAVLAALLVAGMIARDMPGTIVSRAGGDAGRTIPAPRASTADTAPAEEAGQLPLVSIAPVYPPDAEAAGVTGHCVVEYTVGPSGATQDVRAVDCEPRGVFEASAIAAAQQFKYRPRLRDGEPVATPGVRNEFLFTLER